MIAGYRLPACCLTHFNVPRISQLLTTNMSSLFDIRKQFTFYGAYHTNPVNVAIHIVCVPLIIWFATHPLH